MEKHPLYFFIDLIEGRKITDLRNSFLFVNPDLIVTTVNEQEEYIQYLIEDNYQPMIGTSTFLDFISNKVFEKKGELLTTIDLHFLNNPDIKSPNQFVSHIINSLNELILELDRYLEAKKYPVIEKSLLELKESLLRKYNANESESITASNSVKNTNKLQWLGKTNILTTLFYDLINGVPSKKIPPLIKATSKEIEFFIVNNFIDKEGNPFTLNSTVNTNLKPNKQLEKRAKNGDSVDLDSYYKPE